MHFSNYFRWMEEVEHAFFRSLGLSVTMRHEGADVGWPRVSASCEYLAAAHFEDEVELRLRVMEVGRSSLNYEVEFVCREKRLGVGRIISVCCLMQQGAIKSMDIPADWRAKLSARTAVD